MADLYELSAPALDGESVDLGTFRGRVALVVNVASECGYTPQYAGLEALHAELAPRGFSVLGFPSNEFGGQEPGSPAEIRSFCTSRYGVSFPLFAKVRTKAGKGQAPAYALLGRATGSLPAWNFGKYLVGKDGEPLGYYPPDVTPEDEKLRAAIERALET